MKLGSITTSAFKNIYPTHPNHVYSRPYRQVSGLLAVLYSRTDTCPTLDRLHPSPNDSWQWASAYFHTTSVGPTARQSHAVSVTARLQESRRKRQAQVVWGAGGLGNLELGAVYNRRQLHLICSIRCPQLVWFHTHDSDDKGEERSDMWNRIGTVYSPLTCTHPLSFCLS